MSPSASRLFARFSSTVESAGTTGSTVALALGIRSRRAEAQSMVSAGLFCFDAQHEASPRLRRVARFKRVAIEGMVALGSIADGESEILDFLVLHEPGAAAAPPSGGKRSLGGKAADEKIAGVARRQGRAGRDPTPGPRAGGTGGPGH